jgi:general secretion pathway protein K
MNSRGHRQQGLALITVLLIVSIVAGIAAYLSVGQTVWFRQAQNNLDRAQSEQLTRGAFDFAIVRLAEDARTSQTDDLMEPWALTLPPLPTEGGTVTLAIEDAQGAFNLNSLWRNNAPSGPDLMVFQRLLRSVGANPGLAEAVLDWIDPDAQVRPGGAEDIEYLQREVPHRAGNQPFQSVEELRQIRGFEPLIVERLAPLLVALPEPTTINVNTATKIVLSAAIGDNADAAADQILNERQQNPFKEIANFQAKLPPSQAQGLAAGTIGVKSGFFLVRIDVRTGRLTRRTQALLARPGSGPMTVLWRRPNYNLPTLSEGKEG